MDIFFCDLSQKKTSLRDRICDYEFVMQHMLVSSGCQRGTHNFRLKLIYISLKLLQITDIF